MAYDLLIKNGRIVDGSGGPSYRGDVAVKDGKIAEIGKLSGPAAKTIDAAGRAVAPGFIDNHCHYDAQVTWDPLCTFSPEHGATSVIFGNCSLSLAPVRRGTEERLAEFLSYVEAIPMEVLKTVEFEWETVPQYMDRLDNHLGINVGHQEDRVPGRQAAEHLAVFHREILRHPVRAAHGIGADAHRRGLLDPRHVLLPLVRAAHRLRQAVVDDGAAGCLGKAPHHAVLQLDILAAAGLDRPGAHVAQDVGKREDLALIGPKSRNELSLRVEMALLARYRETERAGGHAVPHDILHRLHLRLGGAGL